MNDSIEFVKFSGSGNDFLCLDNRDGTFDELLACPDRIASFARAFCHRGNGPGADGMIFACRPEVDGVSDIAARLFEADGSEAELCGNGTACFVRWALSNGWAPGPEIKVLAPAGVIRGRPIDDSYVRVCIPLPENYQRDLHVTVNDRSRACDFIVTGVPHAVIYVPDVDHVDLPYWGPAFRRHERFAPRGVNANFVQVLGEGRLALRTWEFGVEGETLACGTGSAAAAICAARRFGWPEKFLRGEQPVLVRARSGDWLRVYLTQEPDGRISDLCLETVVRFVYTGRASPDLVAAATAPAP